MATPTLDKENIARRAPFVIHHAQALWWLFMRVSGLALIALALGHLAIQHLVNDVHALTYEWVVQERWSLAGWRVYDALLLTLGFTHGLRGVWQVTQDYVHHAAALAAIKWTLLAGGGLVLLIGAVAIIGAPWG